jgi:di/tricarboxylate transporter
MHITFPFLYTTILLIIMTYFLVREILATEIVVFGVLILLLVGKVVSVEEAFAGFSNTGVLTIGLLFVVAGALQTTGALNFVSPYIFGNTPEKPRKKLTRLLFPLSFFSAFLNNTPIVAMFIPLVRSWTQKFNLSPSKFFIPISYATILGGVCTLIGTSTNLVVHGLLIKNGFEGFSFFEITRFGFPIAILGLLYLILFSNRLLPERKEPFVELGETTREFVTEFKVTEDYPNVGKSIEEAGLRHLKGLFLFQIERDKKTIAPAGPDENIRINDRLFFTGIPQTIVELQKTPGLQLIKDSTFDLKYYDSDEIKTYEAVISESSPLIGKNVRESNFRGKYGAVIIAIHRNGERIKKKIGDIILYPGDTLLILAEKHFMKKWYHSNDFYLISSTATVPSKPQWQATLAVSIFTGMILLTVLNILPLIVAAGLAAIALVLTRSISQSDAKNMVDWKVLLIIASAFGIASAIENSGLAALIASGTVEVVQPFGILGFLAGLYFLTSLYTSFITNNAAAAFLFPVALSMASGMNMELRPFAMIIAIAASADFATPFGYQTNLMVYGPGGYRFKDYLRIGIPLQVMVGLVTVLLVYGYYF